MLSVLLAFLHRLRKQLELKYYKSLPSTAPRFISHLTPLSFWLQLKLLCPNTLRERPQLRSWHGHHQSYLEQVLAQIYRVFSCWRYRKHRSWYQNVHHGYHGSGRGIGRQSSRSQACLFRALVARYERRHGEQYQG